MSFTRGAYSPTDGLKNTTSFPTTPASETAARKQFQDVFDQVLTLLNGLMTALESVTTGSSGAENIGSAAIANVTGTTIRAQISDLKTQLDALSVGSVADGTITTAKLANDAVTGDKVADDAINTEHIADGAVGSNQIADSAVTAGKFGLASVAEANIATGAVTEAKLGSLAVTEGKIGTAAVTQTKIADASITTSKFASTAKPPLVSLWTGSWTSGTKTITGSSAYSVLLLRTSTGIPGEILVSKDRSGTPFKGASSASMTLSDTLVLEAIELSVSGDDLTISKHRIATLTSNMYPSIADATYEIIEVCGIV